MRGDHEVNAARLSPPDVDPPDTLRHGAGQRLRQLNSHRRRRSESPRVWWRLWPVPGFARSGCLISGDGGGVTALELDGCEHVER